jgi:hypothetical protein
VLIPQTGHVYAGFTVIFYSDEWLLPIESMPNWAVADLVQPIRYFVWIIRMVVLKETHLF